MAEQHASSIATADLPLATSLPDLASFLGTGTNLPRTPKCRWSMNRLVFLAFSLLVVVVPSVLAQGSQQADMTVDPAMRRQVIDGVLARLAEAYVFPDTAVAMERVIRDRVRRGEYERITSAQA